MKKGLMNILRCPLCKGKLKLETEDIENVIEGRLICSNCQKTYLIHSGIPRMYVPDEMIIGLTGNSKFPNFIVTPENLDRWIQTSEMWEKPVLISNELVTKFLIMFGWMLFTLCVVLFSMTSNPFDFIIQRASFFLMCLLIGMSITFFVLDYLRYRKMMNSRYLDNLRMLRKMSNAKELSEYDIRISNRDRESSFKEEFKNQRRFVSLKGEVIESVLTRYNWPSGNVVNIGCGGELHKSVSEPFFDRGCSLTGVDVSEDYLIDFARLFRTDVIQANAMSLPLENMSFNLAIFTDILEHLHHPFLGLREVQRVICKEGIVILTTNNRCAISPRCINPLVLIEKIIGIYYERILPPRNILSKWSGLNFYHTEFSKSQIMNLLEATGFKIISFETFIPKSRRLNNIIRRIPILKFMGTDYIIVAKKDLIS